MLSTLAMLYKLLGGSGLAKLFWIILKGMSHEENDHSDPAGGRCGRCRSGAEQRPVPGHAAATAEP